MTGDVFYLQWACLDAAARVHSDTPTVAECEADGWEHVGNDPRDPCAAAKKRVMA